MLTTERAQAITGPASTLVGSIVRPDGTHQVTCADHPLYLFFCDATLP